MTPIAGIALVTGGYTLVYYGVSMWRAYTQAGQTANADTTIDGIPLGYLIGVKKWPKLSSLPGNYVRPTAKPPFNFGGTIYGQTAHTNAIVSQGGSGTSGITPGGGPVL